jgi:hypothetical protein
MSLPKKLTTMLEKYFDEFRESDGGWAAVTKKDIQDLDKIIEEIVKRKTSLDPDGDQTIRWELLNRKTHYSAGFSPLRYTSDLSDDELDHEIYMRSCDVSTATNNLQQAIREKQMRKHFAEKEKNK